MSYLLPTHTTANLLQRNFAIRRATTTDVPACERIARQYPQELAFVRRNSLLRGIDANELHVATFGAEVVGFVSFHARRDGWHTVYDLATDKRYTGLGVGRQLLYSVPCPVRLKTTTDNERANRFYQHAGMVHTTTETGKKRALNVYEMRVLCMLCFGGNKDMTQVAHSSGMAYGVQQFDEPFDYPFMMDIEFVPDKIDVADYLKKVKRFKPVQAMTLDYTERSQYPALIWQIQQLKTLGVLRIKVCPKFAGAVDDIPRDCIIALSVPTKDKSGKFAGWMPPVEDMVKLRGRKIHLLGGVPQKQIEWITRLNGYGATVISVDGNSHQTAATKGTWYESGQWNSLKPGEKVDYYATMVRSGINIRKEINTAGMIKQLDMFAREAA